MSESASAEGFSRAHVRYLCRGEKSAAIQIVVFPSLFCRRVVVDCLPRKDSIAQFRKAVQTACES